MRRLGVPVAVLLFLALTGWWTWRAVVRPTPPAVDETPEIPPRPPAPPEPPKPRGPRSRVRPAAPPPARPPTGTRGTTTTSGAAAQDETEPQGDAGDTEAPQPPPQVQLVQPPPLPAAGAGTGTGETVTVSNTGATGPEATVGVEGGYGWIGTPGGKVAGWSRTPGARAVEGLAHEAPNHRVFFEPFLIQRFEVDNRTWRRFLRETAEVDVPVPFGEARTLEAIVRALAAARAPDDWVVAATVRQMYEANRAVLQQQFRALVVENADGTIDEAKTFERIADRTLPRGMILHFYDRPPPRHWPDMNFPAGEPDHPVRDLSPADAVAFAYWAGVHLPSEEEWEYACRGPNGWDYPWGNGGSDFDARVNGGTRLAEGEEPHTVSVRALAAGASWVGALNTLGNVSEWTSSWLDPYPGSSLPPRLVPVFRGGSAADEEALLVRPAFRGWPATDRAPAWRLRRPWTGVRLAARPDVPGYSLAENLGMEARAAAVPAGLLQWTVYAGRTGFIGTRLLDAAARRWLRPGHKALFVMPLAEVATLRGGVPVGGLPGDLDEGKDVLALSAAGVPVVLAAMHVDLPLIDAWQARAGRRGRPGDPVLDPAQVEPGTWWLALVDGYLAAVSLDLDAVRYLGRRPLAVSALSLHPWRGGAGDARVDLDPASGALDTYVEVRAGDAAVLRLGVRLQAEPDGVQRAAPWTAVEAR